MKQLWHNSSFRKISVFFPVSLLFFLNPINTQNQINQAFMMFTDSCPAGYTDVSNTSQIGITTGFYEAIGQTTSCNSGDQILYSTAYGDQYNPTYHHICAAKSKTTGYFPYKVSEPNCAVELFNVPPTPACPLSISGFNFIDVISPAYLTAGGQLGLSAYVVCRHCYERVKLCQWNP